MKWNKKVIENKDIAALTAQLHMLCLQGNSAVENIRCVYKLKDTDFIYYESIFDWIDKYHENIIDIDSIENFTLYQPFNEN